MLFLLADAAAVDAELTGDLTRAFRRERYENVLNLTRNGESDPLQWVYRGWALQALLRDPQIPGYARDRYKTELVVVEQAIGEFAPPLKATFEVGERVTWNVVRTPDSQPCTHTEATSSPRRAALATIACNPTDAAAGRTFRSVFALGKRFREPIRPIDDPAGWSHYQALLDAQTDENSPLIRRKRAVEAGLKESPTQSPLWTTLRQAKSIDRLEGAVLFHLIEPELWDDVARSTNDSLQPKQPNTGVAGYLLTLYRLTLDPPPTPARREHPSSYKQYRDKQR